MQLTNKIPFETYNCIVMRDVLSVLTKDVLDKSLQEAAAVLKRGGVFIHMQSRESFDSATIDLYSNSNVIVFPTEVSTTIEGLYIVDKIEFTNRVKALSDDNPDKKALLMYIEMYPAEREEFCGLMLLPDKGKEALQYLTQCLRKLNCTSMKKINLNEAFTSRTINGLEQAGFEILKNETMHSEVIVKRKKAHNKSPNSHLFSIDKGVRTEQYLGVLALGMVQEKADVHVIVARKL